VQAHLAERAANRLHAPLEFILVAGGDGHRQHRAQERRMAGDCR